MNTVLKKAIKEDSLFCNHFLNIQIDFLVKLFNKTENPIVGNYIANFLEKIKKYRPIIVDRCLNFWDIKFNFIPKFYKDEKRGIIYLPCYYPRNDIIYTFKNYKDEKNYIKIHLERIEIFFTYNYNKLFKNYLLNRDRKYEKKRDNALKYLESKDIIFSTTHPIVKKTKISKIVAKNINKKIVQHYINEISI